MSTQVQYRRGTATENNAFTGALAEITVDTTNWTLRVHDGVTAGGGGNIATVAYVSAQLAALSANAITFGTSNVQIPSSDGNVRVNVGGTANVGVFSSTGLAITGDLSVTGNATLSGNILGDRIQNGTTTIDIQTQNGNANVTVGGTSNVAVFASTGAFVSGLMSVTGNITGGNVSGTNLTGTLLTVAQPNITSVGTLSSLTVTANVTGGNILTGGLISATGAITGSSLSVSTGNITGGNLNISGGIVDTGALTIVTGSNGNVAITPNGTGILTVSTAASVTGNVDGGNIRTTGLISATGNITGGNVSGTNLTGTLLTAAQTNITSVGTLSSLTVTANVTGGNILTGGLVSATGTVTGSQFNGSGAGLTSIPAANVTGTLSVNTTGSAATLTTARNINGVAFNGSADITVTAAAGTLTGTTLNSTVVTSSLTSVGALNSGSITSGFGSIDIGTDTVTCGGIVNANANGVGNIGSATTYFNTVFAKATSAQYADLAEMYTADANYEPGTVVDFGGTYEITISTQSHSTAVAGIVSTNPSYLMNSTQSGDHVLPVALTGRVPCRVQGPVNKGDVLVTSSTPGVAQRISMNWQPGCVLGKSLESITGSEIKTIEVAVGRF